MRSGVNFDLGALVNTSDSIGSTPLVVVGILYFLVRIVGKYIGAFLGCLATKKDGKVRNYLGLALIPQAGVAIGLAVMIVTVSVILGFKHTIRDKVVGFGSHITVANIASLMSSDQYPIQMDDSMTTVLRAIPGVRHVERYAMTQGILKTDDDFLGVALKGVGPEYDTTFIHQNMVEGSIPHFSDSSSTQRLLISKTIADQLRVKCGERIFAYFINHQGVRTRRFTITGIYETNLKQYDQQMCFTDLYTANRLNGWQEDQYSGAEMLVHDFGQIDEVEHQVVKRVNRTTDHYGETYSSATVTEMNPQIFSWLELMDLNVWLILGLMIAVAIVTMVSGLLIIILERTQMIGVLKALGAKNQQVRHVFLWFATFVLAKGLLWGNALGLGLIALQHLTGFVRLDPQTYYVSTVPVEISWPIVVGLNVATLVVCVAALVVPSFLVSRIHPAKSMHYE